MALFKKILGFALLGFGSLFLIAALLVPFDTDDEDRWSAFAGCLILGVPSATAGVFLVRDDERKRKREAESLMVAEQERLRRVFYQLVEKSSGQMTLMQFAIAANISAEEAKQYLDQQTVAFSANFDSNDKGDLVYQFPSAASD